MFSAHILAESYSSNEKNDLPFNNHNLKFLELKSKRNSQKSIQSS